VYIYIREYIYICVDIDRAIRIISQLVGVSSPEEFVTSTVPPTQIRIDGGDEYPQSGDIVLKHVFFLGTSCNSKPGFLGISLTREGLAPTMRFYLSEMSGFQPLQCDQKSDVEPEDSFNTWPWIRTGAFHVKIAELVNRRSSTPIWCGYPMISCTSMMVKWYVHAKFTKTSKHLGFFTQIAIALDPPYPPRLLHPF
jgi:hypothetical protein